MGHLGVEKCLELMSRSYFWPYMAIDVKHIVNSCQPCNKRKVTINSKPQELLGQKGFPFEKLAIDIAGPLPVTRFGNKYLLSIIDCFSRFPMLVPLKSIETEDIVKAIFEKWIVLFGVPEIIHSDRGSNFESLMFTELCKLLGSKKTRTSPYYPKSNSIVERYFRTIKDMIFASTYGTNKQWDVVLSNIEFGLRCSKQSSTGYSPYEIIFSVPMKIPYALTHDSRNQKVYQTDVFGYSSYINDIAEQLKKTGDIIRKKNFAIQANEEHENPKFKIGELVMAKVLPEQKGIYLPRYNGPYKIIDILNNRCYQLQDGEKVIVRNVCYLKRYHHCKIEEKVQNHCESTTISSRKTDINRVQYKEAIEQQQLPDGMRPDIVKAREPRYPIRTRKPTERFIQQTNRGEV
jgi:transposase InsO family protein